MMSLQRDCWRSSNTQIKPHILEFAESFVHHLKIVVGTGCRYGATAREYITGKTLGG